MIKWWSCFTQYTQCFTSSFIVTDVRGCNGMWPTSQTELAVSPGALEFDPEKNSTELIFQDMSKLPVETKYQKSPSFPIVLILLRLDFKMDDFLAENANFISFEIKLHSILYCSHYLFFTQI